MGEGTIEINRAPVLTLWAAVVAERAGFDWETALTLGKAVAGLNAQAKGRSLGIYHAKAGEGGEPARKVGLGEDTWVTVCHRPVPAKMTDAGLRAVVKDKPIEPAKVETYLKGKFGDDYPSALEAMRALAASLDAEALEHESYGLYETFRPQIARGRKGWGQKGALDLALIASLGRR